MQADRLIGMNIISRAAGLIVMVSACMTFGNGCASAIYSTGKDSDVLCAGTDRAVIIERFGPPIARGTDKFGHDYEVFRARGKIAPAKDDVGTIQMAEAMTLGLGDIIWTPAVVVWSPFLAAGNKDVIVLFDQDGKYLHHTVQRAKSWTKQRNKSLQPTLGQ